MLSFESDWQFQLIKPSQGGLSVYDLDSSGTERVIVLSTVNSPSIIRQIAICRVIFRPDSCELSNNQFKGAVATWRTLNTTGRLIID